MPKDQTVTLNLFQGPSCNTPGECGQGATLRRRGAASRQAEGSVLAEEWALKQVQGDEKGEGRAWAHSAGTRRIGTCTLHTSIPPAGISVGNIARLNREYLRAVLAGADGV